VFARYVTLPPFVTEDEIQRKDPVVGYTICVIDVSLISVTTFKTKGNTMTQQVYSNEKMVVEVDGVDTVFVTSKATNGVMSVQVNDDDGFSVVYSEDDQSLSSLSITIGGEVEILAEAEDVSESTEDVEEVIE
jgi:hypothetical protein